MHPSWSLSRCPLSSIWMHVYEVWVWGWMLNIHVHRWPPQIILVGASLHTQRPWLYLLIVAILLYVGYEDCHYLLYLCFVAFCGWGADDKKMILPTIDTVAEWLRRLTRNQLDLFRVGSSPTGVVIVHFCRGCNGKFSKIKISEKHVFFIKHMYLAINVMDKKFEKKNHRESFRFTHIVRLTV